MSRHEYTTVSDVVFGSPTFRLWTRDFHTLGPARFPGIDPDTTDVKILLTPFTASRPRKFFDVALYREAFDILRQTDVATLSTACADCGDELDSALRELRQLNITFNEAPFVGVAEEAREETLRERVLQPYVRLAEYVYDGLLAWFLTVQVSHDRVKPTIPAELSARWLMARKRLGQRFSASYSSICRNAIVHGGIKFDTFDVHFVDKNGVKETFDRRTVASMYEKLLDICNALAAALAHRVAMGAAGSLDALLYFRGERVLNPATTPFFMPLSCRLEHRAPDRAQLNLYGKFHHWRLEDLLLDVVRALVLARLAFPEATHVFVNFDGPRGTPCCYSISVSDIPTTSGPVSAIADTVTALSKAGFAWIAHERALIAAAARISGVSHALNWLDTVDRKMDFNDSKPDYELRHLKNNSVGWRSRFDATVVSFPREIDLNDSGMPTVQYLDSLFRETIMRWMVRASDSRPWSVARFRVFRSGTLNVYANDAHLPQLLNSGLVSNLLFRFELPIGTPVLRPFFGGTMERCGPYFVAVNPHALEFLKTVRSGHRPD